MNLLKPEILYKVHENDDCDKFQNIIRYLYYKGTDLIPLQIVERNFPFDINTNNLPIIYYNNNKIEGLVNIIHYYEKLLNLTNILHDSTEFCTKNPNYRINDRSTHKNIR